MIKCPECGHEVSDKAGTCPNCGVAIAGHVKACPMCGEIYFNNLTECPACHYGTTAGDSKQASAAQGTPQPERETIAGNGGGAPPATTMGGGNNQTPRKRGNIAIIIGVIIIVVIIAIGFLLYNSNQHGREQSAYEQAMTSTDPQVLQSYLDTYKDAPEAHTDSIMAHLSLLRQGDQQWTNAVVSNSRSALEDYLQRNPSSPHRDEAIHKMDSLDWAQATNANTMDAYNLYVTNNPNGERIDDATNAINQLKAKTVSPDEKAAINTIFKQFFQSINSRDANGLTANVSSFMTSFLGKTDATKSDVITFMDKIYKDDITNMNWHVNNDYKIDKKEIGDNEYEYTAQFSVNELIERTDPTKEKAAKYQVKAKVDPDGKITEFNMVKILE